jgi:alkanesulfonate monooxygenase SsuD/methylene tetrahydromethanopterin reductase-like flavin-dependent oxidoreductase (luciferase family)
VIEFGIFQNGASFAEPVEVDGVLVSSDDLEANQRSRQQTVIDQIRQGILADELGFEYYWLTEHHFQPEGVEFNPNPILTEMAIAVHTKRIRLGQNANILPWHHPLRLAEQLATLDVVSGGRVEIGIGRGYQPREAETLGSQLGSTVQDQERNRSYYEEAYEILLKAFTEPSFSHHGEFFTIPPTYTRWNHKVTMAYFNQPDVGRTLEDVLDVGPPDLYASGNPVVATTTRLRELTVLPQPVQKPYPQFWEPTSSERSIRWAARNGVNPIFIAEPNGRLETVLGRYIDEASKNDWPDRLDRGEFKLPYDSEKRRGCAVGRWIHIVDKGIGDREKFMKGLQMQWDWYGSFGFAFALVESGDALPDLDARVDPEWIVEKKVALVGTVDYVIEEIMRTREICGGEDFNFTAYFETNGMSEEEVEAQMRAFAEEVMPVLRRECGGAPELPASSLEWSSSGS